jgi:hypothetical protein
LPTINNPCPPIPKSHDIISAPAAPAPNDTTAIEIEEPTIRKNLIGMSGINGAHDLGLLRVLKARKVNTPCNINTKQKKGMSSLTGRQIKESTTNPAIIKATIMHPASIMRVIPTETTNSKKETAKKEMNTTTNQNTADMRRIKTTKIAIGSSPTNEETGREAVPRGIAKEEGVLHREVDQKVQNRVGLNSKLFRTKSARPKNKRSHSHLPSRKDSNSLKEKDFSHRHLPHRLREWRCRQLKKRSTNNSKTSHQLNAWR